MNKIKMMLTGVILGVLCGGCCCTCEEKTEANPLCPAYESSGKRLPGIVNLEEAVERAKREKKFLFVQMGREACTNCQKLWDFLGLGQVKLPDSMLYADVDYDDPETLQYFMMRYSTQDGGYYLPWVVILGPDGEQIIGASGLTDPKLYQKIIDDSVRTWQAKK